VFYTYMAALLAKVQGRKKRVKELSPEPTAA